MVVRQFRGIYNSKRPCDGRDTELREFAIAMYTTAALKDGPAIMQDFQFTEATLAEVISDLGKKSQRPVSLESLTGICLGPSMPIPTLLGP